MEAFGRALGADDERLVARVDVGRDELRGVRIRAGDQDGRNIAQVCREPRGDEFLEEDTRRNEYLAAEVTALLRARELILEVHRGGAGLDQGFRQLESVQRTAESGFPVRDDRGEPVHVRFPGGRVLLVLPPARVEFLGAPHRSSPPPIPRLFGIGRERRNRAPDPHRRPILDVDFDLLNASCKPQRKALVWVGPARPSGHRASVGSAALGPVILGRRSSKTSCVRQYCVPPRRPIGFALWTSTSPWVITASSTCNRTASPNKTVLSATVTARMRRHSKFTGDSATREGRTASEG